MCCPLAAPGVDSVLPIIADGVPGRIGKTEVADGPRPCKSHSSGRRVGVSVVLADEGLQGFALAITASVLLILLALWLFPAGLVLGLGILPLSLMTLVILCQGKVRSAFEAQRELEASSRPSDGCQGRL